MVDKKAIEEIVLEKLADSGYFIVSVDVKPGNVIVVEIDHDTAVSIDDCAELSKYIESKLPERETEDFELEVGSAGITSAFKTLRQYTKHIGKEVEVLQRKGIKLKGLLISADERQLTLAVEKQVKLEGAKRKTTITEELTFPLEELKYTKAIINI